MSVNPDPLELEIIAPDRVSSGASIHSRVDRVSSGSSIPSRVDRVLSGASTQSRGIVTRTQPVRWGRRMTPLGIYCKDFIPKRNPDLSTCWRTNYASFGEVVEEANAWIKDNSFFRPVSCEVTESSQGGAQDSSWSPKLRGLRLWVQRLDSAPSHKLVLGYRDFTLTPKGSSVYSGPQENLRQLTEKISTYLSEREPVPTLLSLQTLEGSLTGIYDITVDTENNIPQSTASLTRQCRFLRVFFLSKYQTGSLQENSREKIEMRTKDFVMKSADETLQCTVERALTWCGENGNSHLVNMQILVKKTGVDREAAAWMLENPNLATKTSSFVRIVYTVGDNTEQVDHLWSQPSMKTHCRLFLPEIIDESCNLWSAEWETLDEMVSRMSAWLIENNKNIVSIVSQRVKLKGTETNLQSTKCGIEIPFTKWVTAMYVITLA